jgi:hypothetical protein
METVVPFLWWKEVIPAMILFITTHAFAAIIAVGERSAFGAGGHLSSRGFFRVSCFFQSTAPES